MFGGKSDWLSSEGRISRKDYWLQVILPGAGLMLLVPALNLFGGALRGLQTGIVVVGMFFPVLMIGLLVYGQRVSALTVRRYHDLGKKGPWHIRSTGLNLLVALAAIPLAMIIFMAGYLLIIAALMTMGQNLGLILGVLGVVVALLGVAAWRFYQLAFLPGMHGDNDYGPDPLGGAPSPSSPGSPPSQTPMVVRVARPPANAGFGRRRA